jgi:hypothetical protein
MNRFEVGTYIPILWQGWLGREREVGTSGARARGKTAQRLMGVALARGSDMCWERYSLLFMGIGKLWAWDSEVGSRYSGPGWGSG